MAAFEPFTAPSSALVGDHTLSTNIDQELKQNARVAQIARDYTSGIRQPFIFSATLRGPFEKPLPDPRCSLHGHQRHDTRAVAQSSDPKKHEKSLRWETSIDAIPKDHISDAAGSKKQSSNAFIITESVPVTNTNQSGCTNHGSNSSFQIFDYSSIGVPDNRQHANEKIRDHRTVETVRPGAPVQQNRRISTSCQSKHSKKTPKASIQKSSVEKAAIPIQLASKVIKDVSTSYEKNGGKAPTSIPWSGFIPRDSSKLEPPCPYCRAKELTDGGRRGSCRSCASRLPSPQRNENCRTLMSSLRRKKPTLGLSARILRSPKKPNTTSSSTGSHTLSAASPHRHEQSRGRTSTSTNLPPTERTCANGLDRSRRQHQEAAVALEISHLPQLSDEALTAPPCPATSLRSVAIHRLNLLRDMAEPNDRSDINPWGGQSQNYSSLLGDFESPDKPCVNQVENLVQVGRSQIHEHFSKESAMNFEKQHSSRIQETGCTTLLSPVSCSEVATPLEYTKDPECSFVQSTMNCRGLHGSSQERQQSSSSHINNVRPGDLAHQSTSFVPEEGKLTRSAVMPSLASPNECQNDSQDEVVRAALDQADEFLGSWKLL